MDVEKIKIETGQKNKELGTWKMEQVAREMEDGRWEQGVTE